MEDRAERDLGQGCHQTGSDRKAAVHAAAETDAAVTYTGGASFCAEVLVAAVCPSLGPR